MNGQAFHHPSPPSLHHIDKTHNFPLTNSGNGLRPQKRGFGLTDSLEVLVSMQASFYRWKGLLPLATHHIPLQSNIVSERGLAIAPLRQLVQGSLQAFAAIVAAPGAKSHYILQGCIGP